MKRTITKEFSFESSHRLYDTNLTDIENKTLFGKCCENHGHSFKLYITVSGGLSYGMIINFTELKRIVNINVIELFDHKFINDLDCMKGKLTTSENIIEVIWNILDYNLKEEGVQLERIKLYETATSCCTLERSWKDDVL